MHHRQWAGLGLILALGLSPLGARAAAGPGGSTAPVRATSAAGWVDRSGFGELVYRSITEGYLVGTMAGYTLIDLSDPASGTRLALGGLIGGAVGLALPLLLSPGEVRSGDVALMGAAHGLGMLNGFFIPLTVQLAPCNGTSPCQFETPIELLRLDVGLSAGLSLAAGGVAVFMGQGLNLSPGQAEAMGSASVWGGVVGFFLANAFVPVWNVPSAALGAMVAGADVGFAMAFLMRDAFDMDRSRIWFLDLGVALGGGAGVALAYFISPTFANNTGVSLSILAGAAAGWAVAYYATAGLDGFKNGAPPARAASLEAPVIRPFASMARGEQSVGLQLDLLRGTF